MSVEHAIKSLKQKSEIPSRTQGKLLWVPKKQPNNVLELDASQGKMNVVLRWPRKEYMIMKNGILSRPTLKKAKFVCKDDDIREALTLLESKLR